MSEMAPERTPDIRSLSDAELNTAAQGCTETTCIYHGAINTERQKRGIR